jgi:hypothetical protein
MDPSLALFRTSLTFFANLVLLYAARALVHWGAITSRFPAHDSTCEISSPDQLTENTLVANKELHSGRSSAGSTKAALGGIEEDTEETPPMVPPKSPVRLAAKEESTETHKSPITELLLTPKVEIPESEPELKPEFKPEPILESKSESKSEQQETSPRTSSHSARPSINELFGNTLDFSFLEKPKVKLAPRPSVDRKHYSARISTDNRAALPTGLKAARPASSVVRPMSRDMMGRLPPPPPIPETPLFIPRPKSSSGSVKSLPATLPKSAGNSKERQRLMKFREMYKQREMKTKGKEPVLPSPSIPEERQSIGDSESVSALPVESSMPVDEVDETVEIEHSQNHQTFKDPSSDITPKPEEDDPFISKPEETEIKKDEKEEEPPVVEESSAEIIIPVIQSSKESQPKELDQSVTETSIVDTEKPAEPSSKDVPIVHEEKTEPLLQHIIVSPKSQTLTTEEVPIPASQSSPTSVQDSVGPTSTRPTSVSEVSEQVAPDFSGVQSLKTTTTDLTDSSKTAPVDLDEKDQPDVDDSPLDTSQTTPTPQTPAQSIDTPKPTPLEQPKIDSVSLSIPGHSNNEERGTSISSNASSGNRPRLSIAPPSVDTSMSPSSVEYDDDLLNELSTAEVEEATPVSVSRSPLSSFFSKKGGISGFRAFSAPNGATASEKPIKSIINSASPISRLRSISGGSSLVSTPRSTGDSVPVAKKRVEGGIAAKIADLQRNFSRTSPTSGNAAGAPGKSVFQRANALESTPTPSTNLTHPKRSSSLFPLRKASTPPPDEPPSALDSPTPPTRQVKLGTKQQPSIITSSPNPGRAQESPSVRIRPQSITVRATIIRTEPGSTSDETHAPESVKEPVKEITSKEASGLGLGIGTDVIQSSPITISNHQRAHSTMSHRRSFHPSARSSSVSSLHSTPTPTTPEQRDFLGFRRSIDGWRSFNRRRSLSKSPVPPNGTWLPPTSSPPVGIGGSSIGGGTGRLSPLPRSMSNSSLDTSASTESTDHNHHSKKPNRATRLLRRMSSSISSLATGNRMQLQTLNEKATSGQEIDKVQSVKPPGIAVGDLNVQFPDTLVSFTFWNFRSFLLYGEY